MKTLSFVVALVLVVLSARADDILYLTNGDRLTGRVLEMREGRLSFVTTYAGNLSLDWAAVARVETVDAAFVKQGEKAVLRGRLVPRGDRQGVETDQGWQQLNLTAVTGVTRESDPPTPAASPWSGTTTAGFTLRSGNTDTFDAAVAIEAKREDERNTLTLGIGGAYGQAENVLNTRRHTLTAKWQFYPTDHLYLFGQGLEEQDDGRKLDRRVRVTAGLGYDFIDGDRTKLSGDLGLSHTWENWAAYTPAERDVARDTVRTAGRARLHTLTASLSDGSIAPTLQTARDLLGSVLDIRKPLRDAETRSERYLNVQLGLYFERKVLEHSVLSEKITMHPSLENAGEVQLNAKLAFVTPLREHLDLQIALESAFDSTADKSDVDAWDHTFITGLRYAF